MSRLLGVWLVLIALVGMSRSASAAVTFDQTNHLAADATAQTVTLTVTTGTNPAIMVGVSWTGTTTISTVTYAGVTVPAVTGASGANGTTAHVAIFCLANPTTGSSQNAVVTMSGATTSFAVGVASFLGVNQTTPCANGTFASGTGTSASLTITSATGDVVMDTLAAGGSSVAVSGGQTLDWHDALAIVDGGGSHVAGASSVTPSWSQSSAVWAYAAVNVQAPAGAAAPTRLSLLGVGK